MSTATSLMTDYLVDGLARTDAVLSGPIVQFKLLVNEATGQINGQAQVTEQELVVLPDSEINIGNLTGHIQTTGFGSFTKQVFLSGDAVRNFRPPAIGSVLVPFQAQFVIDDAWDGVGGWTLGQQTVNNVSVHASVAAWPEA